jgi:hypothetical protein
MARRQIFRSMTSDRFVNGRAALLSFAAAGAVLALLLLWLAS